MNDPRAVLQAADRSIAQAETLLNAVQAAARLRQLGLVNISAKTIRAWGRKGVLRGKRVGPARRHVYPLSEVDSMISDGDC